MKLVTEPRTVMPRWRIIRYWWNERRTLRFLRRTSQ